MKAALGNIHTFVSVKASAPPAMIMVPALYNLMPAESVALGWLNEIDALATIRQRMTIASQITGWDVFTFHTLHNTDRFFDTTIGAVRDTWLKEGNLSMTFVNQTKTQFEKPYAYHRIDARLIENLVFQSSLLEWLVQRAEDAPLRYRFIGTGLLSGLVSSRSIAFDTAVRLALKVGGRWDETLKATGGTQSEDEIGWAQFNRVRQLILGRDRFSIGIQREDLPAVDAPQRPFWYSPTLQEQPMLLTTAQDVTFALETLNLASWSGSARGSRNQDEPIRGWLVSPLHPLARQCRWTVSNYLLATPKCIALFLEHVATLARTPLVQLPAEPHQNRLRLSRMKVTGP